jgi:phosphoglycerate dehydrogenase-like enzyme
MWQIMICIMETASLFGRRITDVTIGIVGAGRIGSRVLNILRSFGKLKLLVNDSSPRNFDSCGRILNGSRRMLFIAKLTS